MFSTIYWFCQQEDCFNISSNIIIIEFVASEEAYMPVNDKWFIYLN